MALNSIKLIFTSMILLSVFSVSSLACSYADGYLRPTEYDLMKEAEAVLLAQPVSKSENSVDFEIVEVLKGGFQGKTFRGHEMHTSCTQYSFSVDLELNPYPALAQRLPKRFPKYVLFLERVKGEWEISSYSQGLLNQLIVDTESSSFLRMVRHFIRIGSENNSEIEKKELKKLRQLALSGQDQRAYPKELVGLIDRHLTSPTPSKSYEDLLDLYAGGSEEKKRQVLWAFAWGKHREAANFIEDLLRSPFPANYVGPVSEYITQTKNEPLLVKLGKDYPGLEKRDRWPLMWALIRTAGEQHKELMLAALRSADREEAGRLAEWFVRHPASEATEIVRRHVGSNYQEHWEATFQLAGMGDSGALKWAKEFMTSPHKDRWMAYYTIAHSPLEEADLLVKDVIKRANSETLVSLIQGYKGSHNPNKLDRLRDIVELKSRDSQVNYWLKITLEEFASGGDKSSEELLKALQK